MIYIAPDRTQYTNLPRHIISPELEPLTGADMLISDFPIEMINESTLQGHIQSRALFVQIKVGYDVLSFDGLHNFCARVQKCQIPKSQAILLQIGEYWQDENGLLRLKGSKPYGNTTWRDYRKALIGCELRGVTVFPESLSSMDELPGWIEDYRAMIEKTINEGKRQIYPQPAPPAFVSDDIWQEVEELSPNTWEYLLCAGLKGFGIKTVEAIREYFGTVPHLSADWGFYALKVLTDKENGKLVHNISGWGNARADKLRGILGLPDNCNLALNGKINEDAFARGWYGALRSFRELVENGHNAKDAFNGLTKQANEFFDMSKDQ